MTSTFAAAVATPVVLQSETKTKVRSSCFRFCQLLLELNDPFGLVEHLSQTRPGDRASRNAFRTREPDWRCSESCDGCLPESAPGSTGCCFEVDWR